MSTGAVISVLAWDAPRYLENLLASLFETHRIGTTPHHVYVLDQGSHAETKDVLARYADRIRIITLQENIGFSKGHNLVYREAAKSGSFDYFVVINSDIRFGQDAWLDALVNALATDPRVAVTGPMGINIIARGRRAGHGRQATPEEMARHEFDSISGCLCLFRRSALGSDAVFDEVYSPAYFEDTDLNLRLKEKGYRQVWCPLQFEHHYLGANTSTSKVKRDELAAKYGPFQEQNRQLFLKRWRKKGFVRGHSLRYRLWRLMHR